MAAPGRYGRNIWGTDIVLQNAISGAGGVQYAMASLNTGICHRITAPDIRDIASLWVNWSAVATPGQITLRIETIDATNGKPSGNLYDANATLVFTPIVGWQQLTFASLPTTGLVAGAEYGIVLLTTTGGTTQTLRGYVSGAGHYPTAPLTAADGTTRTNFAEVSSSVPIITIVFEDTVEEVVSCCPFAGTVTNNALFTTNAAGIKFTVPIGISFVVQSYTFPILSLAGAPAGNLRIRILDSSNILVAGTTVTWDKDSLVNINNRFLHGQLLAPVTLISGTYRLVMDSAASANSSNCFRLSSIAARSTAVCPSGFALTTTADVTANPIVWTDTAGTLTSAGLVLDDIVIPTGSGSNPGGGIAIDPHTSGYWYGRKHGRF